MLKKLNSKKILALVMAATITLSVMTGCTDKNVTDTAEGSESSAAAEITTAATSEIVADNAQLRDPVFYESSQIESVTADKTKGRLIETSTSFSIVTKTDMEASNLQNIISVTPMVNFKVDKISNNNFKLELTEPLPENSIAVIAQNNGDGEAVYKWAFQTDGRFDKKEFYPADGSDYVSPDSGIEITFTAPVNAEGAEDYFEIKPAVKGKFQAHRSTLYFIPSEKLETNTRYTVTLKKEFTSADGIELPEDISFSFVTNNGGRGTYCYTSEMSETFIKGDPAVVEIYCSDGLTDSDYSVALYQYESGEAYRKAMQGFIDSDETSSQYEYSTDGLEQIYSDVQKPLSSKSSWGPKFLMLPDDLEEGYYLADISVKAGKDEFRIQRHIQVNPISVYSAYLNGKAQFFINDTVSGNAAEGAEISLATADGVYSAKTDTQGIAMLEVPTDKNGTGLLEIKWGNSVYCDFYDYFAGGEPSLDDLYFSYIYTDRAIYNNDDTINVWGVIRPRKAGLEMPDNLSVTLGYDGLQFPMEMSSDGTFTATLDFKDLNYTWGVWVYLNSGETVLSDTYVQIKDHIKPTYEFETEIPAYVMYPQENPFKVSVHANLFDGTAADGLTFEISGYDLATANPVVAITDENGYTDAEILFNDNTQWQPGYDYVNFNLTGVQNSYTDAYAHTISFYRDIMVEDEYNEDTRKLELTASKIISENIERGDIPWSSDFYDKIRGERTDITADVTITRHWSEKIENGTYYDFLLKENVTEYRYVNHEEVVLNDSFTTTNGKYVIDIPDKKGSYQIDLKWKDSAGRNTTSSFYVYNRDYSDGENSEKHFSFSTDKQSFTENEAVKFTLMNNYDDYEGEGRILLQLHGTDFDDYAVYEGTSFSHIMTAECIPNVTAIGAYFDGRHIYPVYDYYYSDLSFNPEEREIALDITSDKEKYAPGEKTTVTVTAKDRSGNIIPNASVVLSVADEASFAVANQHADPLNELYKDIYNGYAVQYYSYVEHCINEANVGEMGGGDGEDSIRKNFKDTAAFLTGVTGTDGKATFSFDLPDNITEWRATAVAVYEKESDFIYAGASKHPLVVTQPLFIEPIILDEIVEGDDLAVAAHCFGEKAGTEKITVTLTGNGVNLEKTALAGRTINFGKLVYKGEYTVRFKAESGGYSDIVEKKVVVRDSLLEADVTNSFNLADGVDIAPKSWPMCIIFYDAEHILYTDTLYKLLHRAGERLDMRIASAFAYKEFGFTEEADYISEFEGITSTGLAKLLTNSEESVALTAKICAAAPELVNKSTVTKRMYDVLNSDSSHNTDISSAYLALAALGEPVMTEIRDVLENNSFTPTIKPDEFSIEDGLRLTAALALLGDFDSAVEYYNRFTTDMSKGKDKNGDETAYLTSTELTQTAIMPAAILRLPEADSIARHLIGTAQVYDSFALELMVYLNNYSTKSESEAVFTYTRNGKSETVTLDRHFGTHITFTEEQFREANFAVKSGEILAVANYKGNPTQNDTKPTLTVKKAVSGDFNPGGLVTVRISVSGGADENGYNYYTVNDVVPSCGRYDESKNGWANVNGQLLTLYTNQHGVAEYTFRISTSGKYFLESAAARNYDGEWGMSESTTLTVNDNVQNT